jgi:glucose-1-phosphate cytidylyltransferase
MKVVLFCGGLGTRIRDLSESVPKPMIPLSHQPILWHLMQSYKDYGHTDFILCLGYKANIIKEFFLNYRPPIFADCVLSGSTGHVELLSEAEEPWRVTLIDTGVWRNVGERLWAVREHVKDEEIFLANYSDGLANVNLDDMVRQFKDSGKIACFLAVRPLLSYHLADIDANGSVRGMRSFDRSDIWMNAGYFVLRPEIFDYMREGEDLAIEPFRRLIEADKLLAYKHEDFFRAMDTLKDREVLEEMVEQGRMPWRIGNGIKSGSRLSVRWVRS